ncbi:D-xylose transport system substrate-binding protein [Actinoplanes lutulentus]|uniref:D-xylose transport system substrate-binding protein n=1 Tax=Actinoplanes lutulentus TaxID=1287878 RepID=A0A327Z459_9ACTN|nr:substrate-binding domain-containing protein [Actinoplanes lutulentus]MBB2943738.1 D-xylose transport system substrate-binding protein [Actinoplanes lutulentus]RAK29280.1 D-xylose transport system substrate-binding protein [Actinoplanes lutulentus]
MRKSLLALVAAGLLTTVTLTACDDGTDPGDNSDSGSATTSNGGESTGSGGIGVILPDTKSSQRWGTDDPKYLKAAFEAGKVPYTIENAEGDKEQFKRLADKMLDEGAKVLIIANLDSVSGKAVIDDAHSRSVPVIDYDRLTLNGGADYYVSFDNERVGELQAQELVNCLNAKNVNTPIVAELNGSPTDNNATLFKNGYDRVLQTHFDDATFMKGPDQFVQDWDNDEGREIFAQMLKQYPKIGGVLAANDGLGNAAIEVLREKKMNGDVPVTGQDATVQGLQNILIGDQCMTVYKNVKLEADAAAKLAINLYKNVKSPVDDKLKDPESGAYVPFVKLEPEAITKANVKTVVDGGYVTAKVLCTAKFKTACNKAGIK